MTDPGNKDERERHNRWTALGIFAADREMAEVGLKLMFGGRELLDPGLVLVSHWRPEGGVPDQGADRAWTYCGVARV